MFFRKFLTFFVKFWDDPHKRNHEKALFFLGILLIFITSPNSDLRNALIKKQPKIPPKIDEKTTKNRPKLVQKSSIDFWIVFYQFWNSFFTVWGPLWETFRTSWSSVASLGARFSPFGTHLGHNFRILRPLWTILGPSRPKRRRPGPSRTPPEALGPISGPILSPKTTENRPETIRKPVHPASSSQRPCSPQVHELGADGLRAAN